MPRFCANLTLLFAEFPMLDRFSEARLAGFDAVEIQFPYDDPGPELQRMLIQNELDMIVINTPPPNWAGGDRGFAAIPGGEERFRYDFRRALRVAKLLKSKYIHIMAGAVEQGRAAHETFVENLRWAAAHAPEQQLTIEPVSHVALPGYFLCDYDHAAEILDAVDAPNLGLQFDAYHAQMITGDMLKTWEKHKHRAVHIQIASAEGRHEPGVGAIDYPAFFRQLDNEGYTGFVSAEYIPKKDTRSGLGWLRENV